MFFHVYHIKCTNQLIFSLTKVVAVANTKTLIRKDKENTLLFPTSVLTLLGRVVCRVTAGLNAYCLFAKGYGGVDLICNSPLGECCNMPENRFNIRFPIQTFLMLIFHYRRRERLAKEKAAQEAKAAKAAAAGKGGTPKNKLSPEIIRQLAAKDQVLDL